MLSAGIIGGVIGVGLGVAVTIAARAWRERHRVVDACSLREHRDALLAEARACEASAPCRPYADEAKWLLRQAATHRKAAAAILRQLRRAGLAEPDGRPQRVALRLVSTKPEE